MSGWLALLDTPPPAPDLVTTAGDRLLAGWRSADAPPHPYARRVDPRVLDPEGTPAWVSLLWLDRAAMPLFDDPAVVAARRRVLAGPAPRAVSTLVVDSTHFAGSAWLVDEPAASTDDPFRLLGDLLVMHVGSGLLGRQPRPPGPALERYSGAPWPSDR